MPLPGVVSAVLSSIIGSLADEAINAIANTPSAEETAAQLSRSAPAINTGVLTPSASMTEVMIDGKMLPRAPGLLIRNPQNLIVMQNALSAPTDIRYQLDGAGAVSRIWLLSQNTAATP